MTVYRENAHIDFTFIVSIIIFFWRPSSEWLRIWWSYNGNSIDVSTAGGCMASSWITILITGLFGLWRLGAWIVLVSLTEQTELPNPKKSGANLFLFDF